MGCGNGLIYIYITGCKHFQNFQVPDFGNRLLIKKKLLLEARNHELEAYFCFCWSLFQMLN